ncbi:hypothetical protein [Mycoplasma bradburyae]|nr:hypothetical protein [Mycoplasma bradburyae]UTS70544.1 hypothetical protein NMG77_02205 [Mycoplasma bradburyae]
MKKYASSLSADNFIFVDGYDSSIDINKIKSNEVDISNIKLKKTTL